MHEVLHVASYALLGAFGWANRRVTGVPVVLAGGALNALAILANGGVMPADPAVADVAAVQARPGEFINSVPVGDAHLGFLGDVLATPASLPLHNVYSPGDLVIVLGLLIVVHAACHRQKAASSRASADRVVVGHQEAGSGQHAQHRVGQQVERLLGDRERMRRRPRRPTAAAPARSISR